MGPTSPDPTKPPKTEFCQANQKVFRLDNAPEAAPTRLQRNARAQSAAATAKLRSWKGKSDSYRHQAGQQTETGKI